MTDEMRKYTEMLKNDCFFGGADSVTLKMKRRLETLEKRVQELEKENKGQNERIRLLGFAIQGIPTYLTHPI